MTSALNLISENCKHPFPPLCLILSISSLPEHHLSSFGVTVSYPSCQPVERQTAGLLQALCILTSCSQPPVLLSSTFIFFFFINSSWLSSHIPRKVDDFAWRFFPWTCCCVPYDDPWLILCSYGANGFRGLFKICLSSFF